MYQITIQSGGEPYRVPAQNGQTLGEVLRKNIPAFSMPCGGNHTCGKCRVLVRGCVSAPTQAEMQLLTESERASGIRLACGCRIEGDAAVSLLAEGASKIVSWYDVPEIERTEAGFGFAADIGTTTVALQLIDRESGTVLSERLAENTQRGYGADVISRIQACQELGTAALSERIAAQLERMAAECLLEAGVRQVSESVVTGNTTMLHIYEGLDPFPLSAAPFTVPSYFGCMSSRTLAGAPVYLPRCMGAYVGADILCAVLAGGLWDGGVQLLTDIGTNGEMVLVRDGKLLCCSTAAGPAFEGAGIGCGMPAVTGAIRTVEQRGGKVSYGTVGGAPATGICGSGILDALAVMLEMGVLDDTGHMEQDWQIGSSELTIRQTDVRQIQLAKSAVCAGLLALMDASGTAASEVRRFVIAGGFGNTMDLGSAKKIALIPSSLLERAVFIGNGSLAGAHMLLVNCAAREKGERLAKEAVELSLSADRNFMGHYIDRMSFTEL